MVSDSSRTGSPTASAAAAIEHGAAERRKRHGLTIVYTGNGKGRVLRRVATLALALGLDALSGEPPARLHPAVWMGRLLDWLEARAPQSEAARQAYGIVVAIAMPVGWALLARSLEPCAPWPLQALGLKPTFAGRALLQAGRRVELALETAELAQAREELRSLVSRPTARLNARLIAAPQSSRMWSALAAWSPSRDVCWLKA